MSRRRINGAMFCNIWDAVGESDEIAALVFNVISAAALAYRAIGKRSLLGFGTDLSQAAHDKFNRSVATLVYALDQRAHFEDFDREDGLFFTLEEILTGQWKRADSEDAKKYWEWLVSHDIVRPPSWWKS